MSALVELRTRFVIRECGSDGQCCFKVLHCIEFALGASRRALHNCDAEDECIHTRTRIANWMRSNADTEVIRLQDSSALTVAAAAIGVDHGVIHADFQAYCDWIAQPGACGGEFELASFGAMYAGVCCLVQHYFV